MDILKGTYSIIVLQAAIMCTHIVQWTLSYLDTCVHSTFLSYPEKSELRKAMLDISAKILFSDSHQNLIHCTHYSNVILFPIIM